MNTTYKSKGNFAVEKMAGETVILPVNDDVAKLTNLQLLNNTATFILEKMIQGYSKQQIIDDINTNFVIEDQDVLNKEVDDFINKMINSGYFEINK